MMPLRPRSGAHVADSYHYKGEAIDVFAVGGDDLDIGDDDFDVPSFLR